MRKRLWLVALLLLTTGYGVYPYVSLYRLSAAARHGDAEALRQLVDWPRVRAGIKEDICDLPPEDTAAGAALPAFGASFIRGVAASLIDRTVTPEALAAAVAAAAPVSPRLPALPSISSPAHADTGPVTRQLTGPHGPHPTGPHGPHSVEWSAGDWSAGASVTRAFFESPRVFTVTLAAPAYAEPILLQLELTGAYWRVTRIWLPESVLRGAVPDA